MRKVLVLPAGTEIGLEIHQALQYCKEVQLFGAGQSGSSSAPFVYERYYEIPSIYEKNWLSSLVALCNKEQIHYIFPAYDDVIVALSRYSSVLPAVLLAPSDNSCQITLS